MGTEVHPAAIPPDDLLADCDVRAGRGSGPGGQHRNKVETAVTITHCPTGVTGQASERRSQRDNKKIALFRMRVNLAIETRVDRSETGEASDLWRSRCRRGKVSVNPDHEDFPAMLAEALDTIAGCGWEPKDAAQRLGCSATQLVKLLKLEPRGLESVNRERERVGLHRLR
ncbi:MAG: peptide chain release factor family protein [Planctomycetota bacterium]|jgi:hypothetical protein